MSDVNLPNSSNQITDGKLTISYAELPALFSETAMQLQAAQVERGRVLAFFCDNSIAAAVTLLYLLDAGYTFVLLPPQDDKSEQLKPVPLFCEFVITPQSDTKTGINVTQIAGSRTPIADGLETGHLLLRTSGSMGAAKVVVHSHAALWRNAANCVTHYGIEEDDRWAIPIPIFHMYGLGAAFMPAILAGSHINLLANANILRFLSLEKKFRPNVIYLTPNFASMLLRAWRSPRQYKLAVTSGQRIAPDLFTAFNERVGDCLISQYGSSEMGATAACTLNDSHEKRLETIGAAMSGVELHVDGDGLGQLMVRHPHGYSGYITHEGDWISHHAPADWYATGDLAQAHAAGALQVVGRAKNSVNRSGYLVMFDDVEASLTSLDNIAQAVVIKTNKPSPHGAHLTAFCVPERRSTPLPEQLRTACRAILPTYATPDEWVILQTLPLLPSGKVDRQALLSLA